MLFKMKVRPLMVKGQKCNNLDADCDMVSLLCAWGSTSEGSKLLVLEFDHLLLTVHLNDKGHQNYEAGCCRNPASFAGRLEQFPGYSTHSRYALLEAASVLALQGLALRHL